MGWKKPALELHRQGVSWRQIAKTLGVPKSTVSDFLRQQKREPRKQPSILFFDTEVSATVSLTFARFKTNISPNHVVQEPYMLSFAAKWHHSETILSAALHQYQRFEVDHKDDKDLIFDLWKILDQADIVVAHNLPFDIGWLNQRAVVHGLPPISPYKFVDTLKVLKRNFSLPSNSLASAAQYFFITRKRDNSGITLWKRCMEGDEAAFEEMLEYNIGDVVTLEQLYMKIRAFVPNHPNLGFYYEDSRARCVCCGSTDLKKMEKKVYTQVSAFTAYRCNSCGKVNRSRQRDNTVEGVLVNAG